MKLRSLNLRNFRTYNSLNISFHDKFNLIYGNNAQGKTNLLEAVYYISSFRPFKSVKNEELITFGEENTGIKGEIISETGLDEINIHISRGKKSVRLNSKIVYRLSKYVGRFNVVLFLPTDLRIVNGSPGTRRQYLDALICNLNPEHIKDLKDYNKAISHRNSVLSKSKNINSDLLEVWDTKIAEIGSNLTARRLKVIKSLGVKLNELYNSTSGVDAKIELFYKESYEKNESYEASIFNALKENFNRDRLRGHTTVGPHRDYIGFKIDGNDTTAFASQGESKNLVLALKAAEIYMYDLVKGQKPILLLDDITSELDKNRKGFLFALLKDYAGQVFV
ncbi:MAG: DNA replication/repair protein RecF, partial [Thermodesulfobacteriota bacterium]